MSVPAPHFLLFSEARSPDRADDHGEDFPEMGGQWRFVLESVDGESCLSASDKEVDVEGERLELLAVVRGLEALDRPSRVTLVTTSRYVSRGIRSSIQQWRDSDWRWEHFGQMTPIKNSDLWRRVDRALQYHQVNCRQWRFAPANEVENDPENQEFSDAPEAIPLPQSSAVADRAGSAGAASSQPETTGKSSESWLSRLARGASSCWRRRRQSSDNLEMNKVASSCGAAS